MVGQGGTVVQRHEGAHVCVHYCRATEVLEIPTNTPTPAGAVGERSGPSVQDRAERQLAYSELQPEMLDEAGRRAKAAKILAVLRHFLGRQSLAGLTALDIGCSTGFISDELQLAGATVLGMDIDVPGLARAARRFGSNVGFVCADGEAMPLPTASVDVAVFNHIYEHVVDADAVMAEIRRVLKPDGVVYLALGNRLAVVEPHYKLPGLSWLPKSAAHRYVAATGRADSYYETFRTRPSLIRMCQGLALWDYTYTVLSAPAEFKADDMVPGRLAALRPSVWRLLTPLIPTYLWVGTPGGRQPAGPPVVEPPTRVRGAGTARRSLVTTLWP
jgi:ubiquinone/menaquinone biosynthesis C-methylase UbiE